MSKPPLAEQTLLVREPRSGTRRVSERALAAAGIWPTRIWELDSSEAIKRAARQGLGVAFLSRYAVAKETQRSELEHFRIAGQPPLERNLHIARLARRGLSSSERGVVATLTRCAPASISEKRREARASVGETACCVFTGVPRAREVVGGEAHQHKLDAGVARSGTTKCWPCKSNPVRLGSYVSRALGASGDCGLSAGVLASRAN
jgi:LysR substrate binding domain